MKRFARLLAAVAALAAGVFLAVQLTFLARIWWWKDHNPATTAFMEASLERLRAKDPRAHLRHSWVAYERISAHLKRAVIASEDARFTQHEGFDWEAIEKALERNRREGRVVSGASTITQQLARNLFLSESRTLWRKGQEAIVTVMLESLLGKRRILEIYLNVIEWGEGVFGAEAAARHYFRRDAASLGPEPSARLAAMVPNPRYYDRHRETPWLRERTATLLARMPSARLP